MNALRSKRFLSSLHALGPYLLIELLLPGGTLLALLLWLSRGRARSGVGLVHKPGVTPFSVPRLRSEADAAVHVIDVLPQSGMFGEPRLAAAALSATAALAARPGCPA